MAVQDQVNEAKGLLSGMAPPSRNPQQAAPQPQQGGGVKPPPELQKAYDDYVTNGMEVIHSPKSRDVIVERLRQGSPAEALGNTLHIVMSKLDESAKQAGTKIPDEILIPAGHELMANLINVARAAKIFDPTEKEMLDAGYIASDLYYSDKEQQGKLDVSGIDQLVGPGAEAEYNAAKQRQEPQQQPGAAPPGAMPPQGV